MGEGEAGKLFTTKRTTHRLIPERQIPQGESQGLKKKAINRKRDDIICTHLVCRKGSRESASVSGENSGKKEPRVKGAQM